MNFSLVAEGLAAAVVAKPAADAAQEVAIFEVDEQLPTRRVSFAVLDENPFRHGLVDELESILLS